MRCANCGTELLAGKPFCHACGTPAPRGCPSCGRTVQAGFRFCPDCGADLGAPPAEATPPPADDRLARLAARVPQEVAERMLAVGGTMAGERKRVTVLFCDLVGSTAIAEGMDPEEYHDLLEEYLALAFREIYHFDGFVNQLAGDGLMALFGAPIAHEDAPHRAVRAALAIRDALNTFNEERRRQGAVDLRVRIGINTGPVLVGAIGNDLKMDYTAIGDTTNVAARLQSLAQPGAILLSDHTHRLVRGFFAVREAGRLEMKGKSEPVTAFEVLGMSEATTSIAVAAARGLTPLAGREEELAQLLGCYDRLDGRLAQLVSIVGDAGSGKSRLIYEFKDQLADRPAVLLEARCSSLSQMQPYAPWASMVRLYFGVATGDSDDEICAKIAASIRRLDEDLVRIHPYLCMIIGVTPKGVDVPSPEEGRRHTFDAMSSLFSALTHRAPTICIIEDLHWIDEASREMLEIAANRSSRGRFMILASHRPDYEPSWRTRGAFTQIYMRPLTDEQIDEIARSIAGGVLPEELTSLIRLKAEGNPFFAEEIARIVVEENYVVPREGRLELTRPIAELRMPGTVEEALGARLDRLGPQGKRVTQVASVLGRQFRVATLAHLLAGESIDVTAEMATLEQRGVVHRKTVLSSDEYRFGESLTLEAAYESLLLKERRQLHERAAQALAEDGSTPSAERSLLLAYHLGRSNNQPGAIRALLQAAQEAERAPSYQTAMKLYQQAWQTVRDALGEGRDETLMRLAVDAAHGLLRMRILYSASEDADSEEAAERGLEFAEALGDSEKMASLTSYRGFLLMSGERSRFSDGLALVERGLGLAQRAGLEQTALSVARGLGFAYAYDGRFADAGRTVDLVLQAFESANGENISSDLYLGSRFMASLVHFWADNFTRVTTELRDTWERASRARNQTITSGSAGMLGWLHWLRGDTAEARRWADESLAIAEEIGNPASMRTGAAIALAARLRDGESLSLGRYIEGIEQGYIARSDMALKSVLAVDALIAAGELKRAKLFACAAVGHAGGRYREGLAALGLAEALRALGGDYWSEARRQYQFALTTAEAIGSRSTIAVAALGSGLLARAEGQDGAPLIRRGLTLSRELGLGLYVERAEQALA